jgi:hypothetical protein
MIKTPASRKRHYVWLDKPKAEDAGAVLTPDRIWVSIEPAPPSAFDEEKITHLIKCDYHPDITLTTRIRTEDGAQYWVKGKQDVELRHVELWLLCEEVLTP